MQYDSSLVSYFCQEHQIISEISRLRGLPQVHMTTSPSSFHHSTSYSSTALNTLHSNSTGPVSTTLTSITLADARQILPTAHHKKSDITCVLLGSGNGRKIRSIQTRGRWRLPDEGSQVLIALATSASGNSVRSSHCQQR